jgi:hypothetical protein
MGNEEYMKIGEAREFYVKKVKGMGIKLHLQRSIKLKSGVTITILPNIFKKGVADPDYNVFVHQDDIMPFL